MEKVNNMNEQIGNFKRKRNCKKKSTRNAKKEKHSNWVERILSTGSLLDSTELRKVLGNLKIKEITQIVIQRESERKKKKGQTIQGLWHNIKWPNKQANGIPKGEKKDGTEVFEDVMAKNFPEIMKDIKPQIQEGQVIYPNRLNTKKTKWKKTKTHVDMSYSNHWKSKFKSWKQPGKNRHIIYRGTKINNTANFSTENMQDRKQCTDMFKEL